MKEPSRFLPLLPDFSSFSRFFTLFLNFFLIFDNFFAVGGEGTLHLYHHLHQEQFKLGKVFKIAQSELHLAYSPVYTQKNNLLHLLVFTCLPVQHGCLDFIK